MLVRIINNIAAIILLLRILVILPIKINNVFYNIPAPKEYQQYYHHSISHNNLNSILTIKMPAGIINNTLPYDQRNMKKNCYSPIWAINEIITTVGELCSQEPRRYCHCLQKCHNCCNVIKSSNAVTAVLQSAVCMNLNVIITEDSRCFRGPSHNFCHGPFHFWLRHWLWKLLYFVADTGLLAEWRR
jgi:hypothetical protein